MKNGWKLLIIIFQPSEDTMPSAPMPKVPMKPGAASSTLGRCSRLFGQEKWAEQGKNSSLYMDFSDLENLIWRGFRHVLIVKLRIQDFFPKFDEYKSFIYLLSDVLKKKDVMKERFMCEVFFWYRNFTDWNCWTQNQFSSEKELPHENWQVLRCPKCLKSHQSQLRFWLVARLTCYRIWQVFPKVAMLEYQKTLHISKTNRVAMTLFLFFCCVFPVFCRLLLKLKNTSLEIYLQTVSLFLDISRDFRNFDKCWSLDFAEFGQCL